MSPRHAHRRRSRRAFSARVAAIGILLCGATLVAARAASNTIDGSNLDHITNLPGPPPQTTATPSSPVVTDAPSTTPSSASDPSVSPPSSDLVQPPSDPAPTSTG